MNFKILKIPNSSSCGYKSIEHCFFLHFDTHLYTCFSLQSSERLNFSLKNADILVQNVHFIEGHCINSGLKTEKTCPKGFGLKLAKLGLKTPLKK